MEKRGEGDGLALLHTPKTPTNQVPPLEVRPLCVLWISKGLGLCQGTDALALEEKQPQQYGGKMGSDETLGHGGKKTRSMLWSFLGGLTSNAKSTHELSSAPHLFILVERVQVLQGGPDEVWWWVTIDEGQVLAGFQVTAGLDLLFFGQLHLLPLYLERLCLSNALLDGSQRGGGEGAEVVGARDVRQAGHPLILLPGCRRLACWGEWG